MEAINVLFGLFVLYVYLSASVQFTHAVIGFPFATYFILFGHGRSRIPT